MTAPNTRARGNQRRQRVKGKFTKAMKQQGLHDPLPSCSRGYLLNLQDGLETVTDLVRLTFVFNLAPAECCLNQI